MSAIPVGLTSNLYGEKIRLNSATCVASPSCTSIIYLNFLKLNIISINYNTL